eukprot:TRINITY_DN4005_c0_g1_i4.p1 TRINITY_DN4005_c0_g1~~TRINITY_DN4005_c0_g1_i4.p1  ORF type:complete len:188 (+),score=45.68 TRINITY_DN4005_c0_g1_i4:78-641(+)
MRSLKALIVLAVTASCFAVNWVHFDRCNQEWVEQIQEGKLYDCNDPYVYNQYLDLASSTTAAADALATWYKVLDGKACNPGTLDNFARKKPWKSLDEMWDAIKVSVSMFQQSHDFDFKKFAQMIDEGYALLLEVYRESYLATKISGQYFNVITSRGDEIQLPLSAIREVMAIRNNEKAVEAVSEFLV